ncbi:hypothetical protein WS72_30025 [Burkholderia savannae]|uniref:Uncharacterized protein n=1 Tax=Burkholderia savannae TaxID=1637837 RepID=A0ABR5T705_9BURK|nr:hypothetical protein [Burkholderia savannae]KWZ39012.1 hypothetical protein WS72_30025 [Burkholderia savannae]
MPEVPEVLEVLDAPDAFDAPDGARCDFVAGATTAEAALADTDALVVIVAASSALTGCDTNIAKPASDARATTQSMHAH